MTTKFSSLLSEAQEELKRNPFDAGHDFQHHQEVWKNCLQIIKSEKLHIDQKALELAAFWHDYARNNEEKNRRILRELGKKNGIENSFIEKVINIMSTHSFGEGQETLEQKILFDADKLEYIGLARLVRVATAAENGEMPIEIFNKYKKNLNERILFIFDQLHFSSSKREFLKRKKLVNEFANKNKLWNGVVI